MYGNRAEIAAFAASRSAAPPRPNYSDTLAAVAAVQRQVEALAFNFGIDPKPDREIDQFEQDQRDDDIINDRHCDPVELHEHLMRIAVDQTALAFAADPCNGQHTGQHRTDDAADAMHAEGVEAVVISERVL